MQTLTVVCILNYYIGDIWNGTNTFGKNLKVLNQRRFLD